MSVKGVINFCVAIVILIIFSYIYALIMFLSPYKPVLGNLPPRHITSRIWTVLSHIRTSIFWIIVITITCLWIFWLFLKAISPAILGFGDLIVKVTPPFPQLEKAGIFALWSGIVKNLFTLNLMGLIRTLLQFFKTSGRYIVQTFFTKQVMRKRKPKSRAVSDKNGNAQKREPSSVVENKNELPPENEEDVGEEADDEEEETENQQPAKPTRTSICIARNTVPEDRSANLIDRLKTKIQNRNAATSCKIKTIQRKLKKKAKRYKQK